MAKIEIENISFDTDYSFFVDGEIVHFDEINFDIEAADEAFNIVKAPTYMKAGILDNAQVELPIQRNYFRINGTLNPKDLLSQGDVIPMQMINDDEEGYKLINVSCKAIKVNSPNCTLECNIENQPIKCTNNNFTAAKSLSPNYFIKINMNQELMEIETPIPIINEINNKKSSGSLSKGAIAGIVIASVVVVAAIPVVIIKCRKKTPIISQNDNPKILNQTETQKIELNKMKIYDPKKVDAKIYDPKKVDTKIYDPKIKPNDEKIYNGIDKKV